MKPALAPIPWEPLGHIPVGEAVELQGELVWLDWDSAWADLDQLIAHAGDDERRAHQQRKARSA